MMVAYLLSAFVLLAPAKQLPPRGEAKQTLRLPWGESIEVVPTSEVFGAFEEDGTIPPIAKAGDFSIAHKKIMLSIPVFDLILNASSIQDAAAAITDAEKSNEQRGASIVYSFANDAYRSKACTRDEILNSFILSLQLEGIGAPATGTVVEKLDSLAPYFQKLFEKGYCKELAAPHIFSIAFSTYQYIVGGRYGAWFAASQVNAVSRVHCGGKTFFSGKTDSDQLKCVVRFMDRLTPTITPKDILLPAVGISMLVESSKGQQIAHDQLAAKFVEAGVYHHDLIDVPPSSGSTVVRLEKNGRFVWEKPASDYDGLLLRVVGINSCRQVLMTSGIERLCLEEVKADPEKADKKN